jgi:putative two-component system response regulator
VAYIPGRKKLDEERRKLIRRLDDIDLEKLKKAYEDLEFVHRQIRESHIEMILNLAIAAEYKDPDTGNHILRISDYATELAKALKLPKDEIETLRYASPMHDIGKIGIPDKILQKPGKLDGEEWEVMKTHTVIGWRMFANSTSPLLKAVSQIAYTHHEKFDGTGYPNGVKGRDIPLFGRIIAIVDVFDAVVSKRCYKNAWTFREGVDYLKTLAGNHLDPDLVATFVKTEKRISEIYEANLSIQKYIEDFKETDDQLRNAQSGS